MLMGTHYQGTQLEKDALEVYIKLSRAAGAVEAGINYHLKDYGLTSSQFGVLEALYHLGPLHQHELATKILKSSGNLTLVIDNLVKRGLVERERDRTDRRCITICLTEAGNQLIGDIFPRHVERVVDIIGVLTPDEQHQLGTLCRKLGLAQE
jgi:MarR family 2-MHQ and catechol resistance regulon transcriptional repressor